jgi:hypothetical protein
MKGSITLGRMLTCQRRIDRRSWIIQQSKKREIQRDLGIFVNEAEYNKYLIRDFDNGLKENVRKLEQKYASVLREYSFPLKGLLKMIYPEFIQQATREVIKKIINNRQLISHPYLQVLFLFLQDI